MNRTRIEWVKNPDGSQGYTWNPRLKQRYLANRNVADKLTLAENLMPRKYNDPFYAEMRKAPRGDQIIKIKQAYPDKPGVEIARELGISRQRVNLILIKGGYSRSRHRRLLRYCARCGKELANKVKGYFCLVCYNDDLHRRSTVELRCAYCGKGFTRPRGYVNGALKRGYKRFFCRRSCWSKGTWQRRKGVK